MKKLVIVRGAGDLATGVIAKLHYCGFSVLALEIPEPTAIRRHVAFSEAIWQDKATVEGLTAYYGRNEEEIMDLLDQGRIVVAVDPEGHYIESMKPDVVVDATLMKRGITTHRTMAPVVIGIGPGFIVGQHCSVAVESMRGHDLGRIYYQGSPLADTGIPGNVGGYTKERVLHAPAEGLLKVHHDITAIVKTGDVIASIGDVPVLATIDGLVRGMLRNGTYVKKGMKMADIDPRTCQLDHCFKISDKARTIAGGVLEAILVQGGVVYAS